MSDAMRYCITARGEVLNVYRTLPGAAAGLQWAPAEATVCRWHKDSGASLLGAPEVLRLARLVTVNDGQNTEGTL